VSNRILYSSDSFTRSPGSGGLEPVLTNGDEAQGNLPNLGDIDIDFNERQRLPNYSPRKN
jgi:hypothetical protein